MDRSGPQASTASPVQLSDATWTAGSPRGKGRHQLGAKVPVPSRRDGPSTTPEWCRSGADLEDRHGCTLNSFCVLSGFAFDFLVRRSSWVISSAKPLVTRLCSAVCSRMQRQGRKISSNTELSPGQTKLKHRALMLKAAQKGKRSKQQLNMCVSKVCMYGIHGSTIATSMLVMSCSFVGRTHVIQRPLSSPHASVAYPSAAPPNNQEPRD